MNNPAEAPEVLAKLAEADEHVRRVLDEMAVVPNAHRARLMVALRLIGEARILLAPDRQPGDGGRPPGLER